MVPPMMPLRIQANSLLSFVFRYCHSSCFFSRFSSVPERIDISDVNYDGVDEKIKELRAESIAYLKQNLEAAYRQKLQSEQKER